MRRKIDVRLPDDVIERIDREQERAAARAGVPISRTAIVEGMIRLSLGLMSPEIADPPEPRRSRR